MEQKAKTSGSKAGTGPIFLGVVVLVLTGLVAGVVYLSKTPAGGSANGGATSGTGASGTSGTAAKGGSMTAEAQAKIEQYLNSAKNFSNSDPGKAEAILREAINAYPDAQALYLAHADILLSMREIERAYGAFEKAIAIGPRDAKMDMMAGTVADMCGKPERALEHYGAARQAEPGNWEVPVRLAQVQLKLNQITEAKTNLLTAAKLQPEKPIVWGMLAELYLREGSPAIALEQVSKARQMEPSSVAWRLIEARALKRLDRVDEALALLVGLPAQERYGPGVLQLMGECYGLLSMPGEAADLYAGASDADAANGQLAFDAAVWCEKAGRKEQAITYAKRAAMTGTPNAEKLQQRLSEAK
jgi:tetratricopeptide (TPR) repeat protein